MCECYKIGGRFIAEDPNCPMHGVEAQRNAESAEYERQGVGDRIGELETNVEYLLKVVATLTNNLKAQ